MIVGDVEVDGIVEILPEARLVATAPFAGSHGEHASRAPSPRGRSRPRRPETPALPGRRDRRWSTAGSPRPSDEVGSPLEFDEKPCAFAIDGVQQRRAVASGIDADGKERARSDRRASAIEPLLDVFHITLALARITRAQTRAQHGACLRDVRKDGMVTGPPVVARGPTSRGSARAPRDRVHPHESVPEATPGRPPSFPLARIAPVGYRLARRGDARRLSRALVA
jgi:hypothetical protein